MKSLLRPFSVPGYPADLKIVRGQGSYVQDHMGRSYLDAASGLWNVTLGLGHELLTKRMYEQAQTAGYASLFDGSNSPAEILSDRLVGLSEGKMAFAYFSTTGSSAVENALNVVCLYHRSRGDSKRSRIVAFDRGYHGSSYLARGASGLMRAELAAWDLVLPQVDLLPSPSDEACSLEALSQHLAQRGNEVGSLLIEPVMGSGGIIVPSREYCRTVSKLCHEHGVLLIADEVATGGGRCGTFFASFRLCLEPDMIALSKGLTGGYFPLGATLFSSRVIEPLCKGGVALPFGSTQDGNPIGCAAALATLETLENHRLMERAATHGDRILEELRAQAGDSVIAEVRGLGMMIGIELRHGNGSSFTENESARVRGECREEGLLVYHFSSGISLFPPLTMSEAEIDEMLEILLVVLSAQS